MLKLAAVLALALGALVPVLTPCPTEDSTMCRWDATAHGNGAGDSFIALTDHVSVVFDTAGD
jgi:hypothetical protein